jgi:hypothetical protein
MGANSLRTNTTGAGNLALGCFSLYGNYNNNNNIAIGDAASRNISGKAASNIIAIGNGALYDGGGQSNIAIGSGSLCSSTGSGNVAIGILALHLSTTGNENIAIGCASLIGNTVGSYNIGIGTQALCDSTAANYNIAIGTLAGTRLLGSRNIAIGGKALRNELSNPPVSASDQIAIGFSASRYYNGVSGNIGIGQCALIDARGQNTIGIGVCTFTTDGVTYTGANNVVIGINSNPLSENSANSITLGNAFTQYFYTAVPYVSWTSDERDKKDIDTIPAGLKFLRELRPVKFTWNTRDKSRVGIEDSGFIAQEVKAVLEKFNVKEWIPIVNEENKDRLEISSDRLLPVIVQAIQEFVNDHDANITKLKSELAELKKKL